MKFVLATVLLLSSVSSQSGSKQGGGGLGNLGGLGDLLKDILHGGGGAGGNLGLGGVGSLNGGSLNGGLEEYLKSLQGSGQENITDITDIDMEDVDCDLFDAMSLDDGDKSIEEMKGMLEGIEIQGFTKEAIQLKKNKAKAFEEMKAKKGDNIDKATLKSQCKKIKNMLTSAKEQGASEIAELVKKVKAELKEFDFKDDELATIEQAAMNYVESKEVDVSTLASVTKLLTKAGLDGGIADLEAIIKLKERGLKCQAEGRKCEAPSFKEAKAQKEKLAAEIPQAARGGFKNLLKDKKSAKSAADKFASAPKTVREAAETIAASVDSKGQYKRRAQAAIKSEAGKVLELKANVSRTAAEKQAKEQRFNAAREAAKKAAEAAPEKANRKVKMAANVFKAKGTDGQSVVDFDMKNVQGALMRIGKDGEKTELDADTSNEGEMEVDNDVDFLGLFNAAPGSYTGIKAGKAFRALKDANVEGEMEVGEGGSAEFKENLFLNAKAWLKGSGKFKVAAGKKAYIEGSDDDDTQTTLEAEIEGDVAAQGAKILFAQAKEGGVALKAAKLEAERSDITFGGAKKVTYDVAKFCASTSSLMTDGRSISDFTGEADLNCTPEEAEPARRALASTESAGSTISYDETGAEERAAEDIAEAPLRFAGCFKNEGKLLTIKAKLTESSWKSIKEGTRKAIVTFDNSASGCGTPQVNAKAEVTLYHSHRRLMGHAGGHDEVEQATVTVDENGIYLEGEAVETPIEAPDETSPAASAAGAVLAIGLAFLAL